MTKTTLKQRAAELPLIDPITTALLGAPWVSVVAIRAIEPSQVADELAAGAAIGLALYAVNTICWTVRWTRQREVRRHLRRLRAQETHPAVTVGDW